MEFSSPLAAMHPPPLPSWGGRRDLPSVGCVYPAHVSGPSTFNFNSISMQRNKPDYFSARPTRGSSPTASLAADLSSNFHIAQSPQIPTPRRSLFARNMFLRQDDLLATPPVENDGLITPPIPSSSPGIDIMDVSPLPHKAPCFIARVILPSPVCTPAEDMDLSTPMSMESQSMGLPSTLPQMDLCTMILPERKKPVMQRPPLLRPKTYQSTSVSVQPSREALLPAFQFGTSSQILTSTSTPNLLERADSPLEDNCPPSFLSTNQAPRRPSLSSTKCTSGSPSSSVTKKPVDLRRPRKQVRRTLSMFQHPEDVLKDQESYQPPVPARTPAVQDVDMDYKYKLPHTLGNEPDSLPRIQQDTLVNVMNHEYDSHYDNVKIIDCRFEYEFNGGHIDTAINYNDKELLAKDLFAGACPSRTLLIFHCEYSVHRAPRMARLIRSRDRMVNALQYPHLTYPEMYILDGGYSQFFKLHRTRCFPQNYVEMEHKDHERACEQGMGKLKQRAKLSRAQTFAFGQQTCQMEDSPTSGHGSRVGSGRSYSYMSSNDVSPMMSRQFTHRLATA